MDKLLIAGIDPGTVGAYALLDLGKDFNQSKIILQITKYGKIFLVGCDVYQRPNLVSKIASSLGAKVASPDHDLKYLEKIRMVDKFLKSKKEFVKLNNKHEKDALVAALCGLKSVNGLIKKIEGCLTKKRLVFTMAYILHSF